MQWDQIMIFVSMMFEYFVKKNSQDVIDVEVHTCESFMTLFEKPMLFIITSKISLIF